jgi:rubrerythrin
MVHGISPNAVVQGQTDVMLGRPTQHHHNCNIIRLRKSYDKKTTSPQTKVNIMTLVAGEQQTHNYYGEHGFEYGNECLRETYAEIKDVEEAHVTMYESLIDPTESLYEKLLLHEFTEVCTYQNCMKDEKDEKLMGIWEEFLAFEIGHLHKAAELFKKHEKRDPEEVIGDKVFDPCHFTSQKEYVEDILRTQIDQRLGTDKNYTTIKKLPDDWASYRIQEEVGKDGAPSEVTIHVIAEQKHRDIVLANDKLKNDLPKLASKGLQTIGLAPESVTVEEYEQMAKETFVM